MNAEERVDNGELLKLRQHILELGSLPTRDARKMRLCLSMNFWILSLSPPAMVSIWQSMAHNWG
jgi:hypothetical protein